MNLFLTNTELQELTGYKLASKQTSWLLAHGYHTEINARGIPRITYMQLEEMRRIKTFLSANATYPIVSIVNSANVLATSQIENVTALEPNLNQLRIKISKVLNSG